MHIKFIEQYSSYTIEMGNPLLQQVYFIKFVFHPINSQLVILIDLSLPVIAYIVNNKIHMSVNYVKVFLFY